MMVQEETVNFLGNTEHEREHTHTHTQMILATHDKMISRLDSIIKYVVTIRCPPVESSFRSFFHIFLLAQGPCMRLTRTV